MMFHFWNRRTALRSTLPTLLTIAAALLVAGDLAAQEVETVKPIDLEGYVVDEDRQPVVGAFVALVGEDWGSLSDEDGYFKISDIYPGQISLTVEQVGYDHMEWRGEIRADEPVSLTLVGQPEVLQKLSELLDRFRNRRSQAARPVRFFDREDMATSSARTALRFLDGPGGIARIRCAGAFTSECISVGGQALLPVVWVDEGRVIGGLDYLGNMEPHELYMVEVFSSGRHIRAYTTFFIERAAKADFKPLSIVF